jgi:hypothetical protein
VVAVRRVVRASGVRREGITTKPSLLRRSRREWGESVWADILGVNEGILGVVLVILVIMVL